LPHTDVPCGVTRFLRDNPTGLLDGLPYPKTVTALKLNLPYQTNAGGRIEYIQVIEITALKELGKLTL